jgi:hypothetical protein
MRNSQRLTINSRILYETIILVNLTHLAPKFFVFFKNNTVKEEPRWVF